jgi:parallel beta-helix repeat protein
MRFLSKKIIPISFACLALLVTGITEAKTYPPKDGIFDCDAIPTAAEQQQYLMESITFLPEEEVLRVTGTCHVNLVIPENVNDITLDGQGSAQLIGPDSTKDVVRVEGRGIVIKGFMISGGRDGIHIHWGAQVNQAHVAGLEDNIIQYAGRSGVTVHGNAGARMINNIIIDNPGPGIVIGENSNARIGTLNTGNTTQGPNTIERNKDGIIVNRSSTAHIVGNFINDNNHDGVHVHKNSHAHIVGNDVNDNGQRGIFIEGSSTVTVANNNIDQNGRSGIEIVRLSMATVHNNNTSSGAENAEYGLECFLGGVVELQSRGTLNGLQGDVDLDPEGGCYLHDNEN